MDACPRPLAAVGGECIAPARRVVIGETTVDVGSGDWEAGGLARSQMKRVAGFAIDAFEVTVFDAERLFPGRFTREMAAHDTARAAYGLNRDEAIAICVARGGRLPTEDEWLVAAAGGRERGGVTRRYPWGDTGAVCRRAAWGLEVGPCATTGKGPDTVGAHPSGTTPGGSLEEIFDMAGNVAEWVESGANASGVVRGGSWRSEFAAELRTWARREVDAAVHDDSIGARCAYDQKH